MRKRILALVTVALFGMAAGYAQAEQGKSSDSEKWKGSGTSTSTSGSGSGGSADTKSSSGSSTDSDMRSGSASGKGAGSSAGGAEDTGTILKGWSAKKMIMGKDVYNEKDEKIGKIEDVIITPEKNISYAIIGVGGFVGVGEHYVAIPINEVKMKDNKFTMSGATKEQLKQRPKFEYKKDK